MTKAEIDRAVRSGASLDGRNVCRVFVRASCVQFRHAWDDDERAWNGAAHAVYELARRLTDEHKRVFRIHSRSGDLIDWVEPS